MPIQSAICPICNDAIKEAVGRRPGHDTVECSGTCSTWIHRQSLLSLLSLAHCVTMGRGR